LCVGAQESQFNGPQNTLSVVGLSVILKCSSPSKNCNGTEWLKPVGGGNQVIVFNDHGIISRAYSAHRDRYSVDNSSGCDLVIKNVELTDAGRFICRSFVSSLTVDATAYLIIMSRLFIFSKSVVIHVIISQGGRLFQHSFNHIRYVIIVGLVSIMMWYIVCV